MDNIHSDSDFLTFAPCERGEDFLQCDPFESWEDQLRFRSWLSSKLLSLKF